VALGTSLVGVLDCVGVAVWEEGVGAPVREAVGLALWVGAGVVECGAGDDGEEVGLGGPVGVLLGVVPGVGERGVGDLRRPGRTVSVAETASAMAIPAAPVGSSVLNGGEHAAADNRKTKHPTRKAKKVLTLMVRVSRVDV
jgi:hypothetical protein